MDRATDLIDRYLHAVSIHLPRQRESDILAELSANLHAQMEDRAEQLGRPLTEDEQAEVLRRHGHPLLVAARYQPPRSLIGPEIFPFYWFTLERILPLVAGTYFLVQAAVILFGHPDTPTAQHLNVGQLITGLIGALFQSAAWITIAFAVFEFCFKSNAGKVRDKLNGRDWDPRKLPKAASITRQPGPRHPYADVIASGAFLAWLLVFPRFPVLMFGPYVAWHLLNLDLPTIWHQFYWVIVGFNAIQLASKIALLQPRVRRYYHLVDSVIHLLGIGILVFLLRTRDYIGEATFGGNSLSPETVANLNRNIHLGLLCVLLFAIGKFVWDTAHWLRPAAVHGISAPS